MARHSVTVRRGTRGENWGGRFAGVVQKEHRFMLMNCLKDSSQPQERREKRSSQKAQRKWKSHVLETQKQKKLLGSVWGRLFKTVLEGKGEPGGRRPRNFRTKGRDHREQDFTGNIA